MEGTRHHLDPFVHYQLDLFDECFVLGRVGPELTSVHQHRQGDCVKHKLPAGCGYPSLGIAEHL